MTVRTANWLADGCCHGLQLYNHRNRLVNGSRSITPKNGALRMHHHAVRSWEDALIKDRIW